MKPSLTPTGIEAAFSAYCRERALRGDLSLDQWADEQRTRGIRVPEGLHDLRSHLVSLAHAALGDQRPAHDPSPEDSESAARLGPRPGDQVGEYVLDHFIARGGMGTVWKGHAQDSGTPVAIKFIGTLWDDSLDSTGFEREAAIGQTLRHEGLVKTLGTGAEGHLRWLVMEYVAGERSLLTCIREQLARDRPTLAWYRQAAEWIAQVASALEALHTAGFTHRDLKPSNVLLDPSGRPKLADFGLVRSLETLKQASGTSYLGTVAYMSPERVRGEPATKHSDVFSLGVLLYELLTLQRPFESASSVGIARAILEDEAESPRAIAGNIPSPLATIAIRALEKAPRNRYESARAMEIDLERFLQGEEILAKPIRKHVRFARLLRRHPALSSTVLVAGLGAAGVFALVGRLGERRGELLAQEQIMQSALVVHDIQTLRTRLAELIPIAPGLLPKLEAWKMDAQEVSRALMPFRMASGDMHPGFESLGRTLPGNKGPLDGSSLQIHAVLHAIHSLQSSSGGPLSDLVSPQYGWGIERRIGEARRLEQLFAPGGRARQRWAELLSTLKDDARYAGIELPVQVGLIPIGKDPLSGLQEFWHVLSGNEPTRDGDGMIHCKEPDGVVLVLLPASKFLFGAQAEDPSGPNYDPAAKGEGLSPQEVFLSPFFLSKYEFTVAQWERLRGADPCGLSIREYCRWYEYVGLTCPVNTISQEDATSALHQVGLSLPNQFEWEYAARAGTTTIWWTGNAASSLAAAENLRDLSAYENNNREFQDPEPWYDGYAVPTRVDTMQANPFGLHHMLGNVGEWLNDEDTLVYPVPFRLPESATSSDMALYRGGYYNKLANASTCSTRYSTERDHPSGRIGMRPAWKIQVPPARGRSQ